MGWNYTNKGLNQSGAVGTALAALGVLMVIFGIWHFSWNRELVEMHTNRVSPARYREMALPATFGLAVLVSGVMVMIASRRRRA